MTVYVTKWALSDGIIKTEAEKYEHDPRYARLSGPRYWGLLRIAGPRPECAATLEGAQRIAEDMRAKRIASLCKQLARMESLVIKLSDGGNES